MSPIVLALAPFVLFPALVFVFTPASVRRVAVVAGMAVALVTWSMIGGGADNPLYVLPVAAAGISGGAMLIEIVGQLRRVIKGRRSANG